MIVYVGLSHKNAPIEVRERLALDAEATSALLTELLGSPPIGEVAVLSTCNRVEVYASPPRGTEPSTGTLDEIATRIARALELRGGRAVHGALRREAGLPALQHLFRVASSLDSLVVGEPQILGQLKDAIAFATERRALGPLLGRAMHRALHVGKRARTETGIGAGQVSVASVAVDLACQIFGDLRGKQALLVGAGEMAEGAAKLAVKEGAELAIVNRSLERAERLALEVGGTPREWGALAASLVEADIVITSTSSPTHVITRDAMKAARKARKGRSIFIIDIAVPRDVDPEVNDLDGVYLYDVDDLSQIVAESLQGRAAEAEKAERIVVDEVRSFDAWRAEQAMAPTIVGLRSRVRAILAAELERSFAGKLKHLSDADRQSLGVMVDAATNKICHRPSARLKELAADPRGADTAEVLRDLFDLPLVAEVPEQSSAPAQREVEAARSRDREAG
ncbi:MAG: glutamyl-tRNA reductase [Polyangiaceae bacterium]